MNDPRYFVEIDSLTRTVLAVDIITYSAYLVQGNKLNSINLGCEMLEISANEVKNIPGFPEIVGTYKMNADNKLTVI